MHVFKVFNLKLQDVSANFNESQIYILLKPSLERALNYFKDVSQLSNWSKFKKISKFSLPESSYLEMAVQLRSWQW